MWRVGRVTFNNVYCSNQYLETAADVLGKANRQPDRFPIPPIYDELPPVDEDTIAGTSILAKIASEHIKEAVPIKLHEYLDVFKEPMAEHALPPHHSYNCKIDFQPNMELPKAARLYQG